LTSNTVITLLDPSSDFTEPFAAGELQALNSANKNRMTIP
jgi:hypothetical protein